MPLKEKFIISLEEANRHIQLADHLTYVTFPIVKENRLLLKALEEIYDALTKIISAVLQYEYAQKRIEIYKDAKENFRTFVQLSEKYGIKKEQLKKIIDIMALAEKHKKSPFEFAKGEKIVIMSDNMTTETVTLDKIKFSLIETKDFLRKVSLAIKRT